MVAQRASYWALMEHLRQQPAGRDMITVTLQELETVMGGRLPESAWLPGFWAGGIIAEGTWKRCGFLARLDPSTGSVTFVRQGSAPPTLTGTEGYTKIRIIG